MTAPDVLTIDEVAAILRIGRTAAYEAAKRGEIPVLKVGRRLRVSRCRLEDLLAGRMESEPRSESA